MEELGVEPRAAPEVAVFLRALITVLQKCLWNAIHSVPAGFYTIVFISKHARNRFGQKKRHLSRKNEEQRIAVCSSKPFFFNIFGQKTSSIYRLYLSYGN